ncbi:MAG: protein phosphatase 2C domain-containing protein [Caldimonas sp.]
MAASLITPLEPGAASAARAAAAQVARQASHATAWCRIDAAVASACGSQHETNEDAHSALDGAGRLFVVADGVGGGAMAQLASGQLVAHLHAALDAERADAAQVRRAMLDADRAIARRIAQVTAAPGAATVALCAPVNVFASKWLVAWVGDCRVYRARLDGAPRIEALTRDDTFRHLGEAPPPGGSPDDPARMVGNGATAGANVAVHDLAAGDLLVLCSDGVHKWLDAEGWGRALGRAVPLAQRCNDVIALARRNGSVDDATVLLLQRSGFGLRRPRWGANDAHAADAAGSVR